MDPQGVQPVWTRDSRLLQATVAAVALGGGAWLAGADVAAQVVWSMAILAVLPTLLRDMVRSLRQRRPGVDVIALLALGGSLAAGEHLAGAVIAVMLTGGQALEAAAGRRADRDLSALLAAAPRVAHVLHDGGVVDRDVADVRIRDRLVVKAGEVVPVDGILEQDAVLDESTLTGEARPVQRRATERVASGATAVGASTVIVATATAADSTYAGIVALVERARTERAPLVRLADRYAAIFVPLVLAVAGATWLLSGDPVRTLAVLVVATPCPLLLATPVAMTSGISRCARRGIIVKHGGALEVLAEVRTVCFDKTGTLTTGRPHLVETVAVTGWDPRQVLGLAASAEQLSAHPFAAALVAAAHDAGLTLAVPDEATEVPGEGVAALIGGRRVTVGSLGLVTGGGPVPPAAAPSLRRAEAEGASVTFVGVDGRYVAALHVQDPLRVDAARTLRRLVEAGVTRTVLLTGDQQAVAEVIGSAVGVDEVLHGRSPAGKVHAVQRLAQEGCTAMVGDGVNDAPALASADVGIAMGARGATASSEAADVVITVDRLDRVAEAIVVARRTRAIARQSAVAGMSLSLVAMGFAAGGLLAPVAGALLQEAIDVAAIANALRVLRVRGRTPPPPEQQQHSAAFLEAHGHLAAGVAAIRRAADLLDIGDPQDLAVRLREVQGFLAAELLPHERQEQVVLGELVRTAHGGDDVVGSLQRAHQEIERLARLVSAHVEALPPAGPGPADIASLRPVLYGLHTLITFQLAQEEEVYLALTEVGAAAPSGGHTADGGGPTAGRSGRDAVDGMVSRSS